MPTEEKRTQAKVPYPALGIDCEIISTPSQEYGGPEVSEELKALLAGKQQMACAEMTAAVLIPIDEEGDFHILQGIDLLLSNRDAPRDAQMADGFLLDRSIRSGNVRTWGIYRRSTDDLIITDAPYGSKLLSGSYDRERLEQIRSELMQELIDRSIRACEDDPSLFDLERSDAYLADRASRMMLDQGVADATELDLSIPFDADSYIPIERIMRADALMGAMRGDLGEAVERIWQDKRDDIIGMLAYGTQVASYAREHADELTELHGWRADLARTIEESGAKTVLVKTDDHDVLPELRIDTLSMRGQLKSNSNFQLKHAFTEELRKLGYTYSEADAVPVPSITAVAYRGRDIWTREGYEAARFRADARPGREEVREAPSLRSAGKQARAASDAQKSHPTQPIRGHER